MTRLAPRLGPVLAPRHWRYWSVPLFVRRMGERHPELARQVLWPDFLAMAARENVLVRIARISDYARLLRWGPHVCIQIARDLGEKERTVFGMHELCHLWRDDPGEPCYYADDYSKHPREEFADIFAWYVTTPDRPTLRG